MSQQVAKTYDQILQHMQVNGLKITVPRRSLVEILATYHHPFTADDVQHRLLHSGHVIHRATVYRDLELFVQCGILRGLAIRGAHAQYYEVVSTKPHYHFVCRRCMTISDISSKAMDAAIAQTQRQLHTQKMRVESFGIKFYGLCADCLREASSP